MDNKNNSRLSKPSTTNNSLADIINWLLLGDIVVLHSNGKNCQIYHKNCKDNNESFIDKRLIWVDVSSSPTLLYYDEWPWYIKNEKDISECNCHFKKDALCANNSLYFYKMKI